MSNALKYAVSVAACLFALCSDAAAQDEKTKIPRTLRGGLSEHLDLTYARYGARELKLDLYRPKNSKELLPAIVCIHGGGWAKGNRKGHGPLAMAVAARGYVTVTISYRLSGEAPFPAQIHDCKAAVRWLRANAKKYGIRDDKIGAIGLSAGGHLTALLATSGGVKELEGGGGGNAKFDSTIQAAVPMGAQTDLESERTRGVSKQEKRGAIWRQFLGGTLDEKPKTYQLASPLHHLDKNDPPIAFITGEMDDPSTRAATFRKRLKEFKNDASVTVIPGAPHPLLGKQKWFDQAVNAADDFFLEVLKGRI